MRIEPQIHSQVTDKLDEDHYLAYEEVCCDICNNMVHSSNNECMRTWIEIEKGNFCLDCFCDNPAHVISKGFWLENEYEDSMEHESDNEDFIKEYSCPIRNQAEDFYDEHINTRRKYLTTSTGTWYIIT